MAIDSGSKKADPQHALPTDQKFNPWEVGMTALIFLAGVIVPIILGANYSATHPGAVSSPGYIAQIGFWTNAGAFLFSMALLRRRSKWARISAIILIILSGLYFFVLFIGYLLSGFVG